MIETLLRRLIEHKRRKTVVIILTVLTGLLVVLPAADEYNAAQERISTAAVDLADAKEEVADLDYYNRLFAEKQREVKQLESQAVSDTVAQHLRSELVELIPQTGCTMRQIRLGDVVRRDWTEDDDPVRGTSLSERGEPTPYQLETRQIAISLTGSMANLHDFLSRIHDRSEFIHTKTVNLKRSDGAENLANLDIDILLFNLVKKAVD
jgi:hypothetical protein